MATMTHPMMTPAARSLHRASAVQDTRTNVDIRDFKGSVLYAIGVCVGILGISLASVLAPAFGPPSEEAAALIQAQEVQRAAHSWVVMHPEDAVPTGDARAWGFYVPGSESSGGSCAQSWAGSSGSC